MDLAHKGNDSTELIHIWREEYPSFQNIVLLLKHLLKKKNLNDAYQGRECVVNDCRGDQFVLPGDLDNGDLQTGCVVQEQSDGGDSAEVSVAVRVRVQRFEAGDQPGREGVRGWVGMF